MRNAVLSFAFFVLASLALPVPAPAAPAGGQTPPLRWVFRMRRDALDIPHTDVFLCVGPRRVLVMRQTSDEFEPTARADYKDLRVPVQALAACHGYWAGAGDVLYVVRRGPALVVFHRQEDEQAPDFPWKRYKVIPLR